MSNILEIFQADLAKLSQSEEKEIAAYSSQIAETRNEMEHIKKKRVHFEASSLGTGATRKLSLAALFGIEASHGEVISGGPDDDKHVSRPLDSIPELGARVADKWIEACEARLKADIEAGNPQSLGHWILYRILTGSLARGAIRFYDALSFVDFCGRGEASFEANANRAIGILDKYSKVNEGKTPIFNNTLRLTGYDCLDYKNKAKNTLDKYGAAKAMHLGKLEKYDNLKKLAPEADKKGQEAQKAERLSVLTEAADLLGIICKIEANALDELGELSYEIKKGGETVPIWRDFEKMESARIQVVKRDFSFQPSKVDIIITAPGAGGKDKGFSKGFIERNDEKNFGIVLCKDFTNLGSIVDGFTGQPGQPDINGLIGRGRGVPLPTIYLDEWGNEFLSDTKDPIKKSITIGLQKIATDGYYSQNMSKFSDYAMKHGESGRKWRAAFPALRYAAQPRILVNAKALESIVFSGEMGRFFPIVAYLPGELCRDGEELVEGTMGTAAKRAMYRQMSIHFENCQRECTDFWVGDIWDKHIRQHFKDCTVGFEHDRIGGPKRFFQDTVGGIIASLALFLGEYEDHGEYKVPTEKFYLDYIEPMIEFAKETLLYMAHSGQVTNPTDNAEQIDKLFEMRVMTHLEKVKNEKMGILLNRVCQVSALSKLSKTAKEKLLEDMVFRDKIQYDDKGESISFSLKGYIKPETN